MPTFLQLRTSLLGEEEYDRMVDKLGSPSAVRRHFSYHAGASSRLDQTISRMQASSKGKEEGKMYHKVPFHQKDEAKKEGMRWDSNAKKWYHSSPAASSSSKFHREEVEVSEAQKVQMHKPGWMLRADPKLARKVKANIDAAKLRQKYMGKTSEEIAKMRKEEVELDEKHLTPAEKSKREEIANAMERKQPGMDKAKKMAIATATAKRVAEESEQIDEISKATAKSYADKRSAEINDAPEMPFKKKPRNAAYTKRTAQGLMGALKRMSGQKPTSEETDLEEAQFWGNEKMAREAEKASSSTSTVRGRDAKGTYTATYERKKGEKESKETSRVYDTKEEVVSELSTDLLGRYKKAAGAAASAADKSGKTQLANKRFKGIIKATKKQFANDTKKTNEETEQINELNKDTLYSYKKKADADFEKQGRKIGSLIRSNDATGANKAAARSNKRLMGMERADRRLGEESDDQLDELKKSTLASYTNKVIDPVYGMPRTTKKLKQRLAGLQRAHQRAIGKAPVSETTTTTMSPADEKKMFVKVKPERAKSVAKALK